MARMRFFCIAAWTAGMLLAGYAMADTGVMIRDDQLRTSASASAAVSGTAAKGAAVEILGRSGGWTQIRAAGKSGWVRLLSVRATTSGRADTAGEIQGVLDIGQKRSDPSKVVAVAGLRGLSEEELKGARYDPQQLQLLDSYAASREDAQRHARNAGLTGRSVAYLPAPRAEREQESGGWGNSNSSWEN